MFTLYMYLGIGTPSCMHQNESIRLVYEFQILIFFYHGQLGRDKKIYILSSNFSDTNLKSLNPITDSQKLKLPPLQLTLHWLDSVL